MKAHWPLIALPFLTALFFFPDISGGRGFVFGDNLTHTLPAMTFWKQEFLSGRFPLWNPYILGGIPFFADLSNNVLAPTNLFYLFFSVPTAITILVFFYVTMSASFTYLFVRSLVKKNIPSLFAGVVFSWSGTVMAAVNDINSLQGIAYIPLVFYAAQRWLEAPSPRNGVFLSVSLALQVISGHPQYTYYTWMILLPYLLIMGKRQFIQHSLRVTKTFFMAGMLAAIQLVPTIEFSQNAFRPQSLEFSSQNQLQFIELPRFLFANLYGSWKAGSSWGPGSSLETGLANTEGYTGILPLILAVWVIVRKRSKAEIFWGTSAILSLIVALSTQTPLFSLLNQFLPFFSWFRSPVRILTFYTFAISVLSGQALAAIEKGKPQ